MSSKNWAKPAGFHREKKILSRHQPNRRCLNTKSENGVETYLHATKGPRRRREPEIGNTVAGDLYQTFLGSPA